MPYIYIYLLNINYKLVNIYLLRRDLRDLLRDLRDFLRRPPIKDELAHPHAPPFILRERLFLRLFLLRVRLPPLLGDFNLLFLFAASRPLLLVGAPCDVLVPAARPNAITAKNIDRIDCRIILQGANTPSSKPVEYYLKHRK